MRVAILIIIFLLVVFSTSISIFYTDYLWFKDLQLSSVFWYRVIAKVLAFTAGFLVAFGVSYLNVLPSFKQVPMPTVIPLGVERIWIRYQEFFHRFFTLIFTAACIVISILQGFTALNNWETIVLYLNADTVGIRSPVYEIDVKFFLFDLPFYIFLVDWLLTVLIFVFALVAVAYFLRSVAGTFQSFKVTFSWFKEHFYLLLSVISFVLAIRLYLGVYRRAFSTVGTIFGPGNTDVHIILPALKVAASLFALLGIYFAISAFKKIKWGRPLMAMAIVAGITAISVYVIPAVYQAYVVVPSELSRERPYIKNHISMTRYAYDLDRFVEVPFETPEKVSSEVLQKNTATVENIRLWDWRPLLETYNQLQTIRTYYVFSDVDLDRYEIEGRMRQLMIGAREISIENLPKKAKTWINIHLKYTHGYGLVASPVNEVSPEGLPVFFLKNLPVESTAPKLELSRPQIYFGELTNEYAIVGTREKEFDYPAGDRNIYTEYKGTTGVKLDSYLKRLAFSIKFNTIKILLSPEITHQSKILFDRQISKRAEKIAPFLRFDNDPYPVVVDGKIYWILDAYTVSSNFPYSQPFKKEGFNYIRNSVKVVIDAYNGTMDFYVWDERDPVISAYRKAFPDIFISKEEMPEGIKEHLRYPEDYFLVQAMTLSTYHMTDPDVFYNREDQWEIAQELFEKDKMDVQPYYVIMKLSKSAYEFKRPEFLLMLPFTPRGKANMISWMFVSSDPPNYGKGAVHTFQKGKLAYGPMQIESRINQDPIISQQITLWDQAGSRVVRGNMLILPMNGSMLYVEPLYLQSEQSQIPELKRVIVVSGDKVVMADSLESALSGVSGEPVKEKIAEKPEIPVEIEVLEALRKAFTELEKSFKQGDFEGFGKFLIEIRDLLFKEGTTKTSN